MKRRDKTLLGLLVLALVAGTAFLVWVGISRQQRDAAMARLLAPPATEASPTPTAPKLPAAATDRPDTPTAPTATANEEDSEPDQRSWFQRGQETFYHPTRPLDEGPWLYMFPETADGQTPTQHDQNAETVLQLVNDATALYTDWPWRDVADIWRSQAETLTARQWRDVDDIVARHRDLLDRATQLSLANALDLPRVPDNVGESHIALATFSELVLVAAELALRDGDIDRGVDLLGATLDIASTLAEQQRYLETPWATIYGQFLCVTGRALPERLPKTAVAHLALRMAGKYYRETAATAFVDFAQRRADAWPSRIDRNQPAWSEAPLDRAERMLDDVLQKPFSEVVYHSKAGRPIMNRDIATFLNFAARTRDALLLPYPQGLLEARAIDDEAEGLDDSYYLAKHWQPRAETDVIGVAAAETWMRLPLLGILLEYHAAEHGTFPKSLDAIDHLLPGAVPNDPFSDRPFIYRTDGKTYVLYSVGKNQQDDGAAIGEDIVWRAR